VCKFGRNRAICVVVLAICAKSLQTDGQTDDGRRAIVLAHGMSYLNNKMSNDMGSVSGPKITQLSVLAQSENKCQAQTPSESLLSLDPKRSIT